MEITIIAEPPPRLRPPNDTSHPASTSALHATRPRSIAFYTGLVAAPVAIGFGLASLLSSRRNGALAGSLTAAGLVALRWQLTRFFTAEPDHEVVEKIGPLEVRRYAPRIEARTTVTGATFDAALEVGFRRLASYIRGGNQSHEALTMTTPVLARGHARSEQLPLQDPMAGFTHHGYTIGFVMPPGRTMDSLPRPDDDRIRHFHEPERRVALLRFTGKHRGDAIADRERELLRLVAQAGLTAIGAPVFAAYDPPWTLGPVRRNEVWVDLAE